MAIVTGRLVVSSMPALIVDKSDKYGDYTVIVQNLSNSKSVYLDGANVSLTTGFELQKGAVVTVPIAPDEDLYVVTNGSDVVEICFLITKR